MLLAIIIELSHILWYTPHTFSYKYIYYLYKKNNKFLAQARLTGRTAGKL